MTTKRAFLAGLISTASAGAAFGQAAYQASPPTNTDEAQVRPYVLPDPLVMANGRRVRSARTWRARRRPEIIRLFEDNQHGRTPTAELPARIQMIDTGTPGFNGAARRTQVRIRFSDAPETPAIRVLLHTPANATGPVPTLLHIGFSPPYFHADEPGIDEGMAWNGAAKARIPDREARAFPEVDIARFIARGYGVAYVYSGDIDPDFQGGAPFGVRALFEPQTEPRRSNEWGAIGAWAWGLSRVLDYLKTNPAVDGEKVAVSGISRLGKAAIWAGAQDERFALVMPLVSGEGGAAISRRNFGETVKDLTHPDRYPYWYAPRYAEHGLNVETMPVDGHMLVALVAPRPILLVTGATDTWSDPRGEFDSALAAEPVYRLLGKRGLETTTYPTPPHAILHDIGFSIHPEGHRLTPEDQAVMLDFLDMHLGAQAQAGG